MNLKKMQNLREKYIEKFNNAATTLVMDEVGNTSEENKKTIAMFTARDMAIGAAMKRNQHILTGVAIGVVSTVVTMKVIEKIKRRNTEVKEDNESVPEEQPTVDVVEEIIVEDIPTEEDKELKSTLDDKFDILEAIQPIKGTSDDIEELKSVLEEIERHERCRK